jgi:hypothetical protein
MSDGLQVGKWPDEGERARKVLARRECGYRAALKKHGLMSGTPAAKYALSAGAEWQRKYPKALTGEDWAAVAVIIAERLLPKYVSVKP